MSTPQTTREALVAELLGELDAISTKVEQLIVRVETLPVDVATATTQYRDAADAFAAAAREAVKKHIEAQAHTNATNVRALIRETTVDALRAVVGIELEAMRKMIANASAVFRRAGWVLAWACFVSGFGGAVVALLGAHFIGR